MNGNEVVIKSVGNHFKAEDSGVWEKDVVMETQLSPEAQANLSGHVGVAVGGMKTTSQTEIETEVEVEMLVDERTCTKSTGQSFRRRAIRRW